MPLEKLDLTRQEVATSQAIGEEMYRVLQEAGDLAILDERDSHAGIDFVPVWFSEEKREVLANLFYAAERLHWPDPDLPTLLESYNPNTELLGVIDLTSRTVIHGFRMCLPLGRTEADKDPELTGMPVIDDLILGAHLVNGYRNPVTLARLNDYYSKVVPQGREEGIDFPAEVTTIESHFRIADIKGPKRLMSPSKFGYLAVSERTILPNGSMPMGSMLVTYMNATTEEKLTEAGLVFDAVMADYAIPPVDRRGDGTIIGRLDDYNARALVWNRQNSQVLLAGFALIDPIDLT